MGCFQSKEEKPVKSNNETSSSRAQPEKKVEKPKSYSSSSSGKQTVEDKYEIGDEIGRGAFSVVKNAKSKETGERVAVKFIEKKFVDKQDLVLLAREIDIMKKVDHPNVLKLFEVFETDEAIALVMELVTGGELFYKIVEKGNYSEKDAADIVRQMLTGTEYLHSQGIAHRDLKPENLLCSSDDTGKYSPFRVVIADFGLSKVFDNENPLETSCGTPDYVAPEVITAEGAYDKSVDIWSAGVITYVLLCGFSPFLSSTQTGLFEKIIKAEYDFPSPEWDNISETAKDFIRHLLVKDPKNRYTAKQCLEHPWLNGKTGGDTLGEISDKMNQYNETRSKEMKK